MEGEFFHAYRGSCWSWESPDLQAPIYLPGSICPHPDVSVWESGELNPNGNELFSLKQNNLAEALHFFTTLDSIYVK